MTRFLARRVLNYVVLLALASFLTFCLTSVAFSPLESLMQRSPRPPQSVIDAKAADLGLNKPIPLRYAQWASRAVRGDFGDSVTGHPVSGELWRRIGVSLRLLLVGSLAGTSDELGTCVCPFDTKYSMKRRRMSATCMAS